MTHTTYKTSDIVQAAYLRVVGYSLETIEIVGNKGTFVFKNVDQPVLDNYNLGKGRVEPVALNNTIKQLTTSVRRMSDS